MAGREELLLSESINKSLEAAWSTERKLGGIYETYQKSEDAERRDDKRDELLETLRWYVEKLYRDVGILAERMSLPLIARRIEAQFEAIGDLAALHHVDHDIGHVSPHIANIRAHFNSIAVMTSAQAVTGMDVFENILRNTPALLTLREITPASESDVQRAVFPFLKLAFPDTLREPTIGKIFKSYKPDFAVKSLMAVAEYKFVTNEAEVKKALDDLYTDMHGYHGNYEWRTFYALIYCASNLIDAKSLEAEFQGANADANWKAIIVVGPGDRRNKLQEWSLPINRPPA